MNHFGTSSRVTFWNDPGVGEWNNLSRPAFEVRIFLFELTSESGLGVWEAIRRLSVSFPVRAHQRVFFGEGNGAYYS